VRYVVKEQDEIIALNFSRSAVKDGIERVKCTAGNAHGIVHDY
jgi:hypothetical protein